ncbi:3-keto-5-aminohexanoate cleavage protein [Actinomadura sp. ATCC 31491]|uniref:3-keto-5-aminohexanoate cleavage protein n=1 Tax=Actinomadura luzonensis TaxID=2805427 RepID=A0ABT0FNB4_9ACTN|nr:3-keto-5-aminohexanoate cleavage protein [Actinomadura luzonensis]MCK2213391.1 3-keto-5-aminohexanoate cleavage protein [Actinomadura luzonensis]
MLQVCLNGARNRTESAHLPVTPQELAAAAREAVEAGARDIHLHPKDQDGADTLDPEHVGAAVAAVRAAVPAVPVGVTTGAWTSPDAGRRAALVRAWSVLPDHASVNWHEDGAATVADALLERGIGIEAGIYSGTPAAGRFLAWPRRHRVLRVLAEVTDTDPRTAPAAAGTLLNELSGANLPILLHGEETAAWTVLRLAAARGLDTRIGLEDVLLLPDGTPATSNAALIRAAHAEIRAASVPSRPRLSP